ncbi:MAG: ATP-binding protein [Sulfurospirillaceae bacterium]|nr:ATP-binding protein [Sulfurospirillaceae bacterium]
MNKTNAYTDVKNIFIDGGVFDYVNLDKSAIAYDKLVQTLKKPLKIILFFGRPGIGKTFLLQKIYNDLKGKGGIIFFPRPFFDEKEFVKSLYEELFMETSPNFSGYDEFLSIVSKRLDKDAPPISVLIDEAQLYPDDLIEKIRLMADSRRFKFLFTIHKTEKEDILAKDYFTTRIWETIELYHLSLGEVQTYIEKKLLYHNKFEHLNLFKNCHYKLIMQLTQGNLRNTNKLMYKVFEILEYYDENKPSRLSSRAINKKYIEMAALSLGMIHNA